MPSINFLDCTTGYNGSCRNFCWSRDRGLGEPWTGVAKNIFSYYGWQGELVENEWIFCILIQASKRLCTSRIRNFVMSHAKVLPGRMSLMTLYSVPYHSRGIQIHSGLFRRKSWPSVGALTARQYVIISPMMTAILNQGNHLTCPWRKMILTKQQLSQMFYFKDQFLSNSGVSIAGLFLFWFPSSCKGRIEIRSKGRGRRRNRMVRMVELAASDGRQASSTACSWRPPSPCLSWCRQRPGWKYYYLYTC